MAQAQASGDVDFKLGFKDDGVFIHDRDLKEKAQAHSTKDLRGKALLALSFSALGVVYGDIGTSPLYAMSAIFFEQPTAEDVLGAASLIFWTLTLLVLGKYVFLVLRADDNGEGGTFAIYSLLCRAIGVGPYGQTLPVDEHVAPRSSGTNVDLARFIPRHPLGARMREWYRGARSARAALLFGAVLAASMVIGDGVLTPSISVMSAVSGLTVATSAIGTPEVVGITCAILVLLFAGQRLGTGRVSVVFAPVVLVWFLFNAGLGLYNLSAHGWGAFKALSPVYAVQVFIDDFVLAWKALGGVTLCITGAEAMFADMGHFSFMAINLSFVSIVYPCLIITYLGQAAYLLSFPQDFQNVFWAAVPRPAFWPMLVVATATSIVASQALISGAFSIVRQAIMLGVWPQLSVKHTDAHVEGQVYITEVNYALMLGCIAAVAGFQSTDGLGHAYGVAVVTVMVLTSVFFGLVCLVVWEVHPLLVALFVAFYVPLECLFLSSNLLKVPDGGWVALMISFLVASMQLIWWYGARCKRRWQVSHRVATDDLLAEDEGRAFERLLTSHFDAAAVSAAPSGASPLVPAVSAEPLAAFSPQLSAGGAQKLTLRPIRMRATGQPVARMPGLGIVYSPAVTGAPPVLQHLLSRLPALHEATILLTLRFVPIPHVGLAERFLVRRSRHISSFWHVVARYGYMDKVELGDEWVRDLVTSVVVFSQVPTAHRSTILARFSRKGKLLPSFVKRDGSAADDGPTPLAARPPRFGVPISSPPEGAVAIQMSGGCGGGGNEDAAADTLSWASVPLTQAQAEHLDNGAVTPSTQGLTVKSHPAADGDGHRPATAGLAAIDERSFGASSQSLPAGRTATHALRTEDPANAGAPAVVSPFAPLATVPDAAGTVPASSTGEAGLEDGSLTREQRESVELLVTTWRRGVTHILGRARLAPAPRSNLVHRALLGVYRFLDNNTATATKAWHIPQDRALEVGMLLRG